MGTSKAGAKPEAAPGRPRVTPVVGKALRVAVKAARDGGRLRPEHEVHVSLAATLARQLDRAAVQGPPGDVVRLVDSLTKILAVLPILPAATAPAPAPKEAGTNDDPAPPDPVSSGHDPDRELAQLVGSGPSVGYAT